MQGEISLFLGLVAGSVGNDPHTPPPAASVERMHVQIRSLHARLAHGLALVKNRKKRKRIRDMEKVSTI